MAMTMRPRKNASETTTRTTRTTTMRGEIKIWEL
jgi:hypothetical protein